MHCIGGSHRALHRQPATHHRSLACKGCLQGSQCSDLCLNLCIHDQQGPKAETTATALCTPGCPWSLALDHLPTLLSCPAGNQNGDHADLDLALMTVHENWPLATDLARCPGLQARCCTQFERLYTTCSLHPLTSHAVLPCRQSGPGSCRLHPASCSEHPQAGDQSRGGRSNGGRGVSGLRREWNGWHQVGRGCHLKQIADQAERSVHIMASHLL